MAVITYEIPSGRIVHETKVDFSYRSVQKPIHIVQYDKQLPIIAVSLYVSGKTYTLPANMDVNVKFGKRDRTFIYKPVLGCNVARNIVYFEVDEQMSFLHGPANPILELSFVDGEEPQRAGSSPIAIDIDRNPIQESDIESNVVTSDDLFDQLVAKLLSSSYYINRLKELLGTAVDPSNPIEIPETLFGGDWNTDEFDFVVNGGSWNTVYSKTINGGSW